jgi:4-amino-4-deoxy-L-arabinose transferase-like glycosyltransferase
MHRIIFSHLPGVCVFLLLAVSLWFRVWKLGSVPGLNGDEAWFGNEMLYALRGEPFLWRTPHGNPLNPFWCLPLWALHTVFQPSFVLLRSLAVVSGCLALLVNFWLCRATYGKTTAWISTVLLAVLPVNIAYSRFATDPAQTLLVTLPLIYLPLWAVREPHRTRRLLGWCFACVPIALWVHTTNAFGLMWLVIVLLYPAWGRLKTKLSSRRRALPRDQPAKSRIAAIGMLSLAFLLVLLWALGVGALRGRPVSAAGLIFLIRDLARLFSGVTIYRYLSGTCDFGEPSALWWPGKRIFPASLSDWAWLDGVALAIAALLVAALACRTWRLQRAGRSGYLPQDQQDGDTRRPDAFLLIGFGLALLPFYWGVGHMALQPGYERYALWMVAPGALIAARGYHALLESARQKPQAHFKYAVAGAGLTAPAVLLGGFFVQYFQTFSQDGGRAHFTFRTARDEPKLLALREVLAWQKQVLSHKSAVNNQADNRLWIVTADWWNYQPLRYLTLKNPNVHVVPQDRISLRMERFRQQNQANRQMKTQRPESMTGFNNSEYETALRAGQVWFVGFAQSPASALFLRHLHRRGLRFEKRVRRDNGGKPLMLMVHILPVSQKRDYRKSMN